MFGRISLKISIPLYNRNWDRIFERDSKILEKKILPQQVKTEDFLRFSTRTEFFRRSKKFRNLLSYSGKISKTINWDRKFEDGLKISAWVYLQVRSDSENYPANNQIDLQASDSKKFVKPDMT